MGIMGLNARFFSKKSQYAHLITTQRQYLSGSQAAKNEKQNLTSSFPRKTCVLLDIFGSHQKSVRKL